MSNSTVLVSNLILAKSLAFFFRLSHPLMGDDNERICIAISFHVMYLWQLCTNKGKV